MGFWLPVFSRIDYLQARNYTSRYMQIGAYTKNCVMSPICLKRQQKRNEKGHITTDGFVDAQLAFGPSLYLVSKYSFRNSQT